MEQPLPREAAGSSWCIESKKMGLASSDGDFEMGYLAHIVCVHRCVHAHV